MSVNITVGGNWDFTGTTTIATLLSGSIDFSGAMSIGSSLATSMSIANGTIPVTANGVWTFSHTPSYSSLGTGFVIATAGALSASWTVSSTTGISLTGATGSNYQDPTSITVDSAGGIVNLADFGATLVHLGNLGSAFSFQSSSFTGDSAGAVLWDSTVSLGFGTGTTPLVNIGNSSCTTTINATTLKIINAPTLSTVPPYFLVLNGSNQVEQYALAARTDTTNAYLGQGAGTTSGMYNVSIGVNTLNVNLGNSNVAIGYFSLNLNQIGAENTACGFGSLASNISGGGCCAYGYGSLLNNNTANDNTAIGESSMNLTTSGGLNAACGAASLQNNGTGSHSTAMGAVSLINVLSGSFNTALGYSAGSGYTGSESNNLCLGANVTGTAGESNVIRIGNSTQTAMYIYGPASQSAATAALVTTTAPSTVQPAGWVTMIYNPTTQQVGYYTQV